MLNKTDLICQLEKNTIYLLLKIVVILFTTCLNAVLLLVFIFLIKQKSYSNLLFLSIAISDFLIGSVAMSTQALIEFYSHWPYGALSCLFSLFIQYALPDTTILALVFLTIQRFLQIKSPIKQTEEINMQNFFKLFLLWFLTLTFWMISLLAFFLNNQFDQDLCTIRPSLVFILVKEVLLGILPLVLISILNFKSIHFLYAKQKKFMIFFKKKKFSLPLKSTVRHWKESVDLARFICAIAQKRGILL